MALELKISVQKTGELHSALQEWHAAAIEVMDKDGSFISYLQKLIETAGIVKSILSSPQSELVKAEADGWIKSGRYQGVSTIATEYYKYDFPEAKILNVLLKVFKSVEVDDKTIEMALVNKKYDDVRLIGEPMTEILMLTQQLAEVAEMCGLFKDKKDEPERITEAIQASAKKRQKVLSAG